MAGAGLLALLDDIATLLDDVSVMTKVAARKTAGVLGDDLAVNAEKVTGVAAARELPVVYAVFKGSLLNKAILVPAAIVVAAFADWLIAPLLIAGGLFLCFEGFEKVWHRLSHSPEDRTEAARAKRTQQMANPETDLLALERRRVRGAIRTDFILSLEVIVITLGIVGDASLLVRASVLSAIAVAMTFGVYGLVAAIVKIDDVGLHLMQAESPASVAPALQLLGRGLVAFAPRLMQSLTVLGTLAMFLVGGGILVHGVPLLHHASESLIEWLSHTEVGPPVTSGLLLMLTPQVFALLVGLLAGAVVLVLVRAGQKSLALFRPRTPS